MQVGTPPKRRHPSFAQTLESNGTPPRCPWHKILQEVSTKAHVSLKETEPNVRKSAFNQGLLWQEESSIKAQVIFEHCADALLYVFLWNKVGGAGGWGFTTRRPANSTVPRVPQQDFSDPCTRSGAKDETLTQPQPRPSTNQHETGAWSQHGCEVLP